MEGRRVSVTGESFNQRLKGEICSSVFHSVLFTAGMASAELQENALEFHLQLMLFPQDSSPFAAILIRKPDTAEKRCETPAGRRSQTETKRRRAPNWLSASPRKASIFSQRCFSADARLKLE